MKNVPLWWLPLLRSIQITTIAIIITTMAHITGTTRFIFDRMMRMVSSAVRSGISREGAIVPVTTTIYQKRTNQKAMFVCFLVVLMILMFVFFHLMVNFLFALVFFSFLSEKRKQKTRFLFVSFNVWFANNKFHEG